METFPESDGVGAGLVVEPLGTVVGDGDCDGVADWAGDWVGAAELSAGDGDVEVAVTGDGDKDGDCAGLAVADEVGHAVAEPVANGGRTVGVAIPVVPRFPDPGAVGAGAEPVPPADVY